MVRASNFGKSFDDYHKTANENILGVVQIECLEALDFVDEIAAIDGVDVLFIGPADLTMSLGIFGQFDHPLFLDALNKTITAANKAGKATGILIFNPDDYKKYNDMGIRMIACGADATFVVEGARNMLQKLTAQKAL
jgi:4-hydroxy-2-oxoheptanedioate aldolase